MSELILRVANYFGQSLEARMAGKFEIYTDAAGKYRFRLKASNGEIVATGEAYESKASVMKGVEAVQRAAAGAAIDDKTAAKV